MMKKAFCFSFLLLFFLAIALQKSYGQSGVSFPSVPTQKELADAMKSAGMKYCDEVDKLTENIRTIILGHQPQPNWDDVFYNAFKSVGLNSEKDGNGRCIILKYAGYQKLEDIYKYILFDPEKNLLREKTINSAYNAIYGIDPTKDEMKEWLIKMKAKDTWYNIIYANINHIQNQDTSLHKVSIMRAYTRVLGRYPNTVEIKKSITERQTYEMVYSNLINWIYSEDGANELKQTAVRSFTTRNKNYTDDDLNKLIVVAKQFKFTYLDMRNH